MLIKENVIIFIQNLTRRKFFFSKSGAFFFKSKSDALFFFRFKIWHVMKFSIQNLDFYDSTKNAKNWFSRSKMNQNMIFRMQTLFQNLTCRKIFSSKSNALYFFSKKNLPRCNDFKSKSDALYLFYFEI